MAVTDLYAAIDMLYREGSGAVWFTDYDGSESFVSGRLDDVQSPANDPDGIGYFSIKPEGKPGCDVPYDGFEELVECPVGTPV